MTSKAIVVSGYPKSGNTWATRLTAHLLDCPVEGFWQAEHIREIAREGRERSRDYLVYKSHHQWHELAPDVGSGIHKVLYVVRDPRDVVLSGANFFWCDRFPALRARCARLPFGIRIYRQTLYKLLASARYRKQRMVNAVLHGDPVINPCLAVSWERHVSGFLDQDCLVMGYERLLAEPLVEARRICAYLGVVRSEAEIEAAVNAQSFRARKREFNQSGDVEKASFMREGRAGQWPEHFGPRERALFQPLVARYAHRLGFSEG